MLFLITGRSNNCLHSANMISNVGRCGDWLEKKTQNQTREGYLLKVVKVNEFSTSILSWGRFFLILKLCPLEIPQMWGIMWAMSLQRKGFPYFLCFKGSITYLWIVFITLEFLFCSLYFEKNLLVSFFICHVKKTREHTISEG